MSQFYNPNRSKNIYNAKSKEPFKISRSKIDLFLNCPRCFYFDRKMGIGQPPGYPFNLNSAVDALLKKEFDIHRAKNKSHPLMKKFGLDLVPFEHKMMDVWRANFKGVEYFDEKTNLIITGAVDDIWIDNNGVLYVVDYKSTSKSTEVNLDADWQIGYKRQMEVYQWLLRKNEFKVSDTGYFVYCNGRTDVEAFDGKLEFDVKIIPYVGNDKWIENTITNIFKCLNSKKIPESGNDCDFCKYRKALKDIEK